MSAQELLTQSLTSSQWIIVTHSQNLGDSSIYRSPEDCCNMSYLCEVRTVAAAGKALGVS